MESNIRYTVVNKDSIDKVVSSLLESKTYLGFDTETTKEGNLKYIQIYSPEENQTFIFDVSKLDIHSLVLCWSSLNVVGHNIQYDLSACFKEYHSYPNPIADTFLLACSLQEEQKGLKPLCNQYFGFPIKSWEDLFGDYNYKDMTDEKLHYIANDPYYTYILFEYYKKSGAYTFVKKAHDIDIKAMIPYMLSSTLGILIDQEKFNTYLVQYTEHVSELQDRLNLYAGWEVRTTSTKDLKKLLFEQMCLPTPPITTDKGEVSVSKEALSYVPDKDGVISLITQIKESRSILAAMKSL